MPGILVGLIVGVAISVGFAWYLNRAHMPFQDKGGHGQELPPPAASGPEQLPPKPGDKPQEKPRFDFYKILPQGQAGTPAPGAETAPVAVDRFYLQIGAFQKAADADNLKARLALMGMEASVQDVSTDDKTVMHRVRTGPYDRPEDMNRVRNQLAQNGIQASVIKIRETPANPAESKPAEPKPVKQ